MLGVSGLLTTIPKNKLYFGTSKQQKDFLKVPGSELKRSYSSSSMQSNDSYHSSTSVDSNSAVKRQRISLKPGARGLYRSEGGELLTITGIIRNTDKKDKKGIGLVGYRGIVLPSTIDPQVRGRTELIFSPTEETKNKIEEKIRKFPDVKSRKFPYTEFLIDEKNPDEVIIVDRGSKGNDQSNIKVKRNGKEYSLHSLTEPTPMTLPLGSSSGKEHNFIITQKVEKNDFKNKHYLVGCKESEEEEGNLKKFYADEQTERTLAAENSANKSKGTGPYVFNLGKNHRIELYRESENGLPLLKVINIKNNKIKYHP